MTKLEFSHVMLKLSFVMTRVEMLQCCQHWGIYSLRSNKESRLPPSDGALWKSQNHRCSQINQTAPWENTVFWRRDFKYRLEKDDIVSTYQKRHFANQPLEEFYTLWVLNCHKNTALHTRKCVCENNQVKMLHYKWSRPWYQPGVCSGISALWIFREYIYILAHTFIHIRSHVS